MLPNQNFDVVLLSRVSIVEAAPEASRLLRTLVGERRRRKVGGALVEDVLL